MTDSTIEDNIQIILRQTNYNYAEAKDKLLQNDNNYMAVIRLYLNNGVLENTEVNKPLSLNQQTYKEIRKFMAEKNK